MTKMVIEFAGAKTIVCLAAAVPAVLLIYAASTSTQAISIAFLLSLEAIISLHLWYGFKWARWFVAIFSTLIALIVLYTFINVPIRPALVMSALLLVAVIFNSIILLRSTVVTEFLLKQATSRSVTAIRVLKLSRWIFFIVAAIGIVSDLRRIFF